MGRVINLVVRTIWPYFTCLFHTTFSLVHKSLTPTACLLHSITHVVFDPIFSYVEGLRDTMALSTTIRSLFISNAYLLRYVVDLFACTKGVWQRAEAMLRKTFNWSLYCVYW